MRSLHAVLLLGLACALGTVVPLHAVALTGVTLTCNPATPQPVQTPITLTAIPTGGVNVEYKFRAGYQVMNSVWNWTVVREYATTPGCTWTPTEARTYTLTVWAREHGSTLDYQVYKILAYQVTPPPISKVTLAANPVTPTAVGIPVKLTATITGGVSPRYWFRVKGSTATAWTDVQAYAATSTCTWTPTAAGSYTLQVLAKEATSTKSYEVYAVIAYTVKTAITGVGLAATPAATCAAGTAMTLTATPTGGATLRYAFRYRIGTAAWTDIRAYAAAPICTWTPTAAGSYTLEVLAQEVGSTKTLCDVYKVLAYTVTPPPVSAVTLAAAPLSPQPVGTPVTLTAGATAGTPVEYQFRAGYQENGVWTWTVLQAYGSATTCMWIPAEARAYTLVVWARAVGSSKAYDAYIIQAFRATPGMSGVVKDVLTGASVAGAAVTLGTQQAISAADGTAAFSLTGAQPLTVTCAGYETLNTRITCALGAHYTWSLVPVLAPADDASFQIRSEQAMAVARAFQAAQEVVKQDGTNPPSALRTPLEAAVLDDHLLALTQTSRGLSAVLANVDAYTPPAPTAGAAESRGLLSFFGLGAKSVQFARGADGCDDLKQRVLRGEDVPEINAWLAANPYAGYASLAQARADQDIFGDYLLQKIVSTYLVTNPDGPFLKDVVGAGKDIVVGQYTGAGTSLIKEGIGDIWSQTTSLFTAFDVGKFAAESGDQFVWLFDKIKQKWGLFAKKPDAAVTVPSSTFNVAVTAGLRLQPVGLVDYAVAPTAPQTVPIPDRQATRVRGQDGAALVWVPGGTFTMGSPSGAGGSFDEYPEHQVTLSGYWLYKYDVTVAQYRAFCAATGRALPSFPWGYSWAGKSGWADPALQQHPIVEVRWYDAQAYADWAGVALPTEAQWEYASRGPQGNNYPWGGTATAEDPYNGWDQTKCVNYYNSCRQNISTWPVGSFPAGASWCGALDMAGNVWQWCRDWYGPYSSTSVTNPTGPATGTCRVMRGGSWLDGIGDGSPARGAYRGGEDPNYWNYYIGFRCVSSPPGP